ncbi:MAG: antibiotic biosynthesis monooxygenase [Dehalococcoidia bacterium]
MAYVRLSIAKPRRGEEQRVSEMMHRLADLASAQAGCVASYVLQPHDDSGEIARIAIYESEAAAENLANSTSVMALRSELHLAIEAGHTERAFFSE